MKLIFLDCDGTINCKTTKDRINDKKGGGGLLGIDSKMLKRVKKICKKTGAKIVLSSCWRVWDENKEYLKNKGLEWIGETPDLNGKIRGEEIKEYLMNCDKFIEKYAILDDDSDMLEGQPLFQTTWKDGLTEKITNKVIKYLNGK